MYFLEFSDGIFQFDTVFRKNRFDYIRCKTNMKIVQDQGVFIKFYKGWLLTIVLGWCSLTSGHKPNEISQIFKHVFWWFFCYTLHTTLHLGNFLHTHNAFNRPWFFKERTPKIVQHNGHRKNFFDILLKYGWP